MTAIRVLLVYVNTLQAVTYLLRLLVLVLVPVWLS
jgi:hypothetical protein